jgi:hypothetical protein
MDIPHNGENAAPARNAVPIFLFLTAAGLAGLLLEKRKVP